MKRHWLILAAFLLVATLGATTAKADHILAATMNWAPTDGDPATTEIRFKATVYLDLDHVAGKKGLPAIVSVGDIYCAEQNEFEIDFGDGTPHANPICFQVAVVNASENWVELIALNPDDNTPGLTHTYADCTERSAAMLGRWRATSVEDLNNRGSDFTVNPMAPILMQLTTNVSPCATNSAPVSATSLPIVEVCEAPSGDFRTFAVTATDPGDNITYRIASNTEATGDPTKDGPPSEAAQPAISIDPATGVVTWYNHGLASTKYYSIQVMAEDHDGNGPMKTQTPIDFLLAVVPDTTAPTFDLSISPNTCDSPCDHAMVNVHADITNLGDRGCSGRPTVKLLSITSSQADDGLGWGDLPNDIQMAQYGTDDRDFKLRCEAIGGTRTYTIIYEATDPGGNSTTDTAIFTVQPLPEPIVTITLSPNCGNDPCSHDLLNIHANLDLSRCRSGYTVKLVSITCNQADGGLGLGDIANDIQNALCNTDDRDFKLRCEAIGGRRCYTIIYCITDPCGGIVNKTVTFNVDPSPEPIVTLTLSPDIYGSPCSHSLLNIHANLNVTNCRSGYTVKLVSITCNQADGGLGLGDIVNDIQNALCNTDDRDFKLRCEAIGGPRCYTVTYCITDPCGWIVIKTATCTVPSGPTIHVSLSPNSCNSPCKHSLVNVSADVDVNVCTSRYSVQLISITSSQADSGLGDGDICDDIQNESLNTNDCSFKLRCEAIGADRTYTVIYRVTDENGGTASDTATFTVNADGDCDDGHGLLWDLLHLHKQDAETGALSSAIMLEQNYPNPFSSVTDIDYSVAQSGQVTIEIIDMQGERVRTLYNGETKAGVHTAQWDGTDDQGKLVRSGGYLYRVTAASCGCSQTKQLILMR